MLRDHLIDRAKKSQARSRGLGERNPVLFRLLRFPANMITDSYRPCEARDVDARSSHAQRGRESPRSVAFAYEDGSRRRRSRSPGPRSNGPSNASSCRTRSPTGHGRSVVSYSDLDHSNSRMTAGSTNDSGFGSHGPNAHVARPRFVTMKDSDSTQYYEFAQGEFKVGTIIRAPVHEEDTNRTPQFPHATSRMSEYQASRIRSHVSHTPQGPVWSESRFLIVVECFGSHYMAVPLFTYEGTGLLHKPDRNEYVSIQDHRYPGTSKGEAPHTLLTAYLAPCVKPMKSTSVAHLTAPISRKYRLHVKYQGRLNAKATATLVELYNKKGRL